MRKWMTVDIDHTITLRRIVRHQIDEDEVREWAGCPEGPIGKVVLCEFLESQRDCGEPIAWLPMFDDDLATYSFEDWDLYDAEMVEDDAEAVEEVAP